MIFETTNYDKAVEILLRISSSKIAQFYQSCTSVQVYSSSNFLKF